MNKDFLKNAWFIRIVSLFFSIFLYMFVASENASVPIRMLQNPESASVNISETISNVPVFLGKTDDDTFVSGVPETVDVRLTGPRNIINQVTSENLRVETEDLTNMQPGSRAIRYIVTNLPEDVDFQITPSRTIVQISKKESITLPIEYDIDNGVIDSGMELAEVILTPSEVTLTGNNEIIKKIDRVYINITSKESNQKNFYGTYAIKIVDKDGNLLDVNANANNIKADVRIRSKSKDVKVELNSVGEDQQNYSYSYEFVSGSQVKITGDSNIESIKGSVDVSGMTESGNVPVILEFPKGVQLAVQIPVEVFVNIVSKNNNTTNSKDIESTQETTKKEN